MIGWIFYGLTAPFRTRQRGGCGAALIVMTLVIGVGTLIARVSRDTSQPTAWDWTLPTVAGIGLVLIALWAYSQRNLPPLAPAVAITEFIPFRAGVMAVLGCSVEFADELARGLDMDPELDYPKEFYLWLLNRNPGAPPPTRLRRYRI